MSPAPLNVTSPPKLFSPFRVIELTEPFAKSVVWLIASSGVIVPFAPSVNSSFAKENRTLYYFVCKRFFKWWKGSITFKN